MSRERLACEGGAPVRDATRAPWPTWPVWNADDEAAIRRVLHSGQWWSGGGGENAAFAREFAAFHDARFAVPCTNGTHALQAALQSVCVEPGDEVVIPAYTFVATASAVLAVGAIPVFADVEPDTLNLDAKDAETRITPRTRAIIAVHAMGRPADLDALQELARRRSVKLIEDAAQAHGASWRGVKVGAIGDAGAFSFQASKNLNAGEGGIVVTNDSEAAERAWSLINVGRERETGRFRFDLMGSNFRLHEFQAAILRVQLLRLPEQTATRTRNAAHLRARLQPLPALHLPADDPRITAHAYHLFTFRLDLARLGGKTRDDFVAALAAEGVSCSSGYTPLYRHPFFASPAPFPFLPVCEQVCQDTIWLPQTLLLGTEADINDIGDAIAKIVTAWHS